MASNPVRFMRKLTNGNFQEAGNKVQIENSSGAELGTPANPINVELTTGTDVGRVFGLFISKSFEFGRPANTTAYHAHDSVNVDLAVSGASNASPIVITTPTHGLADGDPVTISGVTGNTNANGSYYAKVTGYLATTFGLYTDKALTTPRAGNANYINGGDVARLFRLKDFFREAGGSALINKIRALTDNRAFVDQFRILFYGSPVAASLDHVALPILYANRTLRMGAVDLEAFHTEDTGAGSTAAYSCTTPGNPNGVNFPLEVHNLETPPSKDLYCLVVDLSTGAPVANQAFFIEVTGDQN